MNGKTSWLFCILAIGAVLAAATVPTEGKSAKGQPETPSKKSGHALPTCSSNRPEMICIPGGSFTMGTYQGDRDEEPPRKVWVDEFMIDKYEVTFGDYDRCVKAGRCREPRYGILNTAKEDVAKTKEQKDKKAGLEGKKVTVEINPGFPVVGVSWQDALTYCESLGKRLPTEAEWEKAARGTRALRYPWGNTPPTCEKANIAACSKGLRMPGNHPMGASPYGVMDMTGNVWEWVYDWYDADFYKTSDTNKNPFGPRQTVDPVTGNPKYQYKCLRGGSYTGIPNPLWVTYRFRLLPDTRSHDIGFRCAMSKDGKSPIPREEIQKSSEKTP